MKYRMKFEEIEIEADNIVEAREKADILWYQRIKELDYFVERIEE